MSEEKKISEVVATELATPKSRRGFVKTAAQVAVTAPAVALLLSASTKSASAQVIYDGVVGDDGAPNDDTEQNENQGTLDNF